VNWCAKRGTENQESGGIRRRELNEASVGGKCPFVNLKKRGLHQERKAINKEIRKYVGRAVPKTNRK